MSFPASARAADGRLSIAEAMAAANAFVLRAVPAVSARTLGACRISFAGLLLFFWCTTYSPASLSHLARNGGSIYFLYQFDFLRSLSGSAAFCEALYLAVTVGLILFLAGLLTAVAYPLLVAAFWLVAFLINEGHFITPLLLAMAVTLRARWSDDLSVDRMLGLARPIAGRSPLYGYPIWLLGLCIALAYAAAGLSKLYLTKGAWLWGTGVRWGFAADLDRAATDLGLWFVNNYWLAVLGSIFAAFGQIAYLWAAFTRSDRIKTAIGVFVAFPFLLGLILFMGLFWWPWAVLVALLYVPWKWLDAVLRPASANAAPAPLANFPRDRRLALAAVWFLLIGHAFATVANREIEPVFSNYPMYAIKFPMGGEAPLWSQYKSRGRNFHHSIELIGSDGSPAQYGPQHRFHSAFSFLYRSASLGLRPDEVWQAAEAGQISNGLCNDLKSAAARLSPTATSIRYGRRTFDFVDGQLQWLPITRSVTVPLTEPACRSIRAG